MKPLWGLGAAALVTGIAGTLHANWFFTDIKQFANNSSDTVQVRNHENCNDNRDVAPGTIVNTGSLHVPWNKEKPLEIRASVSSLIYQEGEFLWRSVDGGRNWEKWANAKRNLTVIVTRDGGLMVQDAP